MFDSALQEGVSCSVDDRGVAVVTFAHPRSNSLPGAVLAELAETIRGLGDRADVRVVVLGSAGDRAFCAGASFDELIAISDEEEGLRFFMGFANVINAIRSIAPVGHRPGSRQGGRRRSRCGLGGGLLPRHEARRRQAQRTRCRHRPLCRRASRGA